jgi:predicted RNA binding protein YcfA (HicA-like mRNA interferase family)
VKHADLVRLLTKHGCHIERDCGKHTVWINPKTDEMTTVPRHKEIKKHTARAICKSLSVNTDGISFA